MTQMQKNAKTQKMQKMQKCKKYTQTTSFFYKFEKKNGKVNICDLFHNF